MISLINIEDKKKQSCLKPWTHHDLVGKQLEVSALLSKRKDNKIEALNLVGKYFN